jgi:iron-sulfur cluster assembly accessory protein
LAARQEVLRLGRKYWQGAHRFRLGLEPGGCSGWVYTLDFNPTLSPEDHQETCDGIEVIIAPQSLASLKDMTLDYAEDLTGGNFRFHNPDATGVCNCGNSFGSLSASENCLQDQPG